MAQSGRVYQQLSPQEQAGYEQRAKQQIRERAAQQQAVSEAAASALELDRQRQAAARCEEGVRNLLSEARLSADRLTELQRSVVDSPMSVSEAEAFVRSRMESPAGLSSSQLEALLCHQDSLGRPERAIRPAWVKQVSQHRNHFQGAVFMVSWMLPWTTFPKMLR